MRFGCRCVRGWARSYRYRPDDMRVAIAGQDVRWVPAVDINRIVLGGQIVAIVGLLVVRAIIRARRARRG